MGDGSVNGVKGGHNYPAKAQAKENKVGLVRGLREAIEEFKKVADYIKEVLDQAKISIFK